MKSVKSVAKYSFCFSFLLFSFFWILSFSPLTTHHPQSCRRQIRRGELTTFFFRTISFLSSVFRILNSIFFFNLFVSIRVHSWLKYFFCILPLSQLTTFFAFFLFRLLQHAIGLGARIYNGKPIFSAKFTFNFYLILVVLC